MFRSLACGAQRGPGTRGTTRWAFVLPWLLLAGPPAQAGIFVEFIEQLHEAEMALPHAGQTPPQPARVFDEEACAADVEATVRAIDLGRCRNYQECLPIVVNAAAGRLHEHHLQHPDDGAAIDRVWSAYLLYDFAFLRHSKIVEAMTKGSPPSMPPDLPRRAIEADDVPGGRSIPLVAYYLDQGSPTTIVMAGGFRAPAWQLGTAETDLLRGLGFNLLMPALRGGGESGGDFITHGYYEKADIAAWVKDELARRPNQEIVLYGGSMGGATVLAALNDELPAQVKAVIEVSGFRSLDGQLAFLLGGLADADRVMWALESRYLVPRLHLNIHDPLPLGGVRRARIAQLFIHGDKDVVVPVENAVELSAASAAAVRRLAIVQGAGHGGDIFSTYGAQTSRAMRDFIDEVLPGHAAPSGH